jgi:hypothetical protein
MVKNKISIGMGKSDSNYGSPIFSIIALILLYYTYYYLVKLESCICVHGNASGENRADLQKLRYIELFFIVIALLGLIAMLFIKYDMNQLPYKVVFGGIYIIILLVVYVYLVTNVLKLYRNIPSDCKCALEWPRYYLYLQAWLASIVLFLYAFVIILGLVVLLYMSMLGKK